MAQRGKRYTILIIPDDRGRTTTLKLHSSLVRMVIALVVLFAVGTGYLLYRSGAIALRLQLITHLEAENKRLRAENSTLEDVKASIQRLVEMDEYFERLAVQSGAAKSGRSPALRAPQEPEAKAGATTQDSGESAPAKATATEEHRARFTEQMLQSIPYVRPVQGWITRPFTKTDAGKPGHTGVDFAAAEGTPIRATAPGLVTDVFVEEFLGKVLVLQHKYGFTTRYGHCSYIMVGKGEHVRRGQTVAMVGNTGQSSAPHLHYEVLKNGKQVNPMQYIVD